MAPAQSREGIAVPTDDGVITRDEWPSPEREMASMDQDGDGRVTLAEIAGDDIQIHRRAIIRTR